MEKTSAIQVVEQAQSKATTHAHTKQQSIFSRVVYFILHFVEMCVVMCVGLVIFDLLLARVGSLFRYSQPDLQLPELSTVALAIWFTLIMIAWMRLRRHEWRTTLEMASTSIVALIPLLGAYWYGLVPKSDLLGLECGVACAFMVVAMLLRLDHYTTSHTSHQQQVHDNPSWI